MAIQIGGTTVIDDNRNINAGIGTFTDVDVLPTPITFNPTDGATGVSTSTNIVITFGVPVVKNTGNITLRESSGIGTVIQTIGVGSTSVTVSSGQVTIDPPSNLGFSTDVYVVVDAGAFNSYLGNSNTIIDTYNFTTTPEPPSVSSFSPTDGATGITTSTNIVITFNQNVSKGTGDITLRSGSSGGTVLQTIGVSSTSVAISGGEVTIDPPSDLPFSTGVYVVVDAGAFVTATGGQNIIIDTYNFTTGADLGSSYEGGFLICQSTGVRWVVAPSSSQVSRNWNARDDASTRAQQVSGCTGWFVPSLSQLQNPGYTCRQYWDSYSVSRYWSSTQDGSVFAFNVFFGSGAGLSVPKTYVYCVRAFRCVTY